MSGIKISIIIPIYNAEKEIERCLESVQNQTYSNIEIICVNDCSQDSSIEIVKEKMQNDERILLINNEVNSGTLISRKIGVERAGGDYILFADNDDWYETDACEILAGEVDKAPADIILYSIKPVDQSEDPDEEELKKIAKTGKAKPEEINADNCIHTINRMNWLWNKLVKANICKQAYSYTKDIYLTIAEDTYACWLIHYFAKSFRTIPNVLYNWNVTSGVSNRKNYSLEKIDDLCKCMIEYEDAARKFFEEVNASDDVVAAFEDSSNVRIRYCYNTCVFKTSEEDYAKAFGILLKYYGQERIYDYIRRRTKADYRVTEKQRKKIENLQKQADDIKKSRSFVIGKAITAPGRMIKKIGKNK